MPDDYTSYRTCPSCLGGRHRGACNRDPDQVKAEKHRREVAALTRRVFDLQDQLAAALRHAHDAAHGDADDLVVLADHLADSERLWGSEPVGEHVAPCGCNYDVMGDGRCCPAVVCEEHVRGLAHG